jgi:hypothetical protein
MVIFISTITYQGGGIMAKKIAGIDHGVKCLLGNKHLWDFVIALGALIVGSKIAGDIQSKGGWFNYTALIGTFIVFLAAVFKCILSYREEKKYKANRINALEGGLYTICSILSDDATDRDKIALRSTIHVPVKENKYLQQIVEYVGFKRTSKSAIGREFPVQSGIIGKAYREKSEYLVANRKSDNYEDYVQELVRVWNYTEQQARDLNPAAMSWMAVPLLDNEEVIAVVFLESHKQNFFDDEEKQKLILYACIGLARFVTERYN